MAENKLSDPTINDSDLDVKIEPFQLDATSLHFDFIPLNLSPKPEIQVDNMPNEQNGQKRKQTAHIEAIIDVISKKPRIDTLEDDNIKSAKAVDETDHNKIGDGDETDLNKKGGGDETDLNNITDGDKTDLNKIGDGDETDLNKKGGGDETDLNNITDGDKTDLNKKGGGDETDLNKMGDRDETDLNKKGGGDETDLNKIGDRDETDLNKKGGGDETDLNKIRDRDETDLNKIGDRDETDLHKKGGGDEIDTDKVGVQDEMDQSSVTAEYYLIVNNLPSDWTNEQIKNYLSQECGLVDEMETLLRHNKTKGTIRLTFRTFDKCGDAFKKLEDKFVQDKKLRLKICDVLTASPTDPPDKIVPKRWRPDLDCLNVDPEGLYGLRPEFLKALGLQPPLTKIVNVTNYRCSKAELKDVMELAGNVYMCCELRVDDDVTNYSKFIYSHPLEAVQAISMLNGQMVFGIPLKITMSKNPALVLPKGLANVGPGLGIKARPLRNIVEQYHKYANKKKSVINHIIFSEIDFSDGNAKTVENPEEVERKINEFLSSRTGIHRDPSFRVENFDKTDCPNSMDRSDRIQITTKTEGGDERHNVGSPQGQTTNGGEDQQSSSPPLECEVTPSPGFMTPSVPMRNPLPGPREPFFTPGNPQECLPFRPRVSLVPVSLMMQQPPSPLSRPPFRPAAGLRLQIPPTRFCRPPRANVEDCVTIKLSNIPPSTTVPLLCDLLSQCGEVVAVHLTTPNTAMATFSHPSHAERCFRILSQAKEDSEETSINQPDVMVCMP